MIFGWGWLLIVNMCIFKDRTKILDNSNKKVGRKGLHWVKNTPGSTDIRWTLEYLKYLRKISSYFCGSTAIQPGESLVYPLLAVWH